MIRFFTLVLISLLLQLNTGAQQKRALLIGINKYLPTQNSKQSSSFEKRNLHDLDGPVNDVEAINNIIISKFGFKEQDVITLLNEQGSRDGILLNMRSLLDLSQKGDVALLYYAGHGSQVYNSLSSEIDKKDETIVPADAWKEGVKDIRDKELAALFNLFLDKGVILTVIFDCCHSGSLQRGPGLQSAKKRFAGEEMDDAKDPVQPPPPESKPNANFLFLAAAQDNEASNEKINDFGQVQGVFTNALISAINQLSVQVSSETFFTSLRAILKSNGESQEPVLTLSTARKEQTLLGITKSTIFDKTLVAVSGFDKTKIVLQGGFALGIYPQTQLTKIEGKDTIVLKVDSVFGLSKSTAIILRGVKTNIKAGQFFEIANWVASTAPLLRVYIPSTNYSYLDISNFVTTDKVLRKAGQIYSVTDLAKKNPDYSIFSNNGNFYINDNSGTHAIANPDLEVLKKSIKKGSSYYFEIPPDKQFVQKLKQSFEHNKSLSLVNSADEANYLLYGITDETGKPAYGLRNPTINVADSLGSMPLQTMAFPLESNSEKDYEALAGNLYNTAQKLSKLKAWIQLSPPRTAEKDFPFHVELVDLYKNQVKKSNDCRIGDSIGFHIVLNINYSPAEYKIPVSYLYVFVVDRDGKMQLVFPSEGNGVNNEYSRFPFINETKELIRDKELLSYNVVEPAGTDNFFLLVTDHPINNCEIYFNQDGVNYTVGKGGADDPLINILNMGNEGYHARDGVTLERWTLMKFSVKSMH